MRSVTKPQRTHKQAFDQNVHQLEKQETSSPRRVPGQFVQSRIKSLWLESRRSKGKEVEAEQSLAPAADDTCCNRRSTHSKFSIGSEPVSPGGLVEGFGNNLELGEIPAPPADNNVVKLRLIITAEQAVRVVLGSRTSTGCDVEPIDEVKRVPCVLSRTVNGKHLLGNVEATVTTGELTTKLENGLAIRTETPNEMSLLLVCARTCVSTSSVWQHGRWLLLVCL